MWNIFHWQQFSFTLYRPLDDPQYDLRHICQTINRPVFSTTALKMEKRGCEIEYVGQIGLMYDRWLILVSSTIILEFLKCAFIDVKFSFSYSLIFSDNFNYSKIFSVKFEFYFSYYFLIPFILNISTSLLRHFRAFLHFPFSWFSYVSTIALIRFSTIYGVFKFQLPLMS